MSDFPLAPFLTALAADGIPLTLRDYERIHLALQTGGPWSIPRLRDTLLALLAKDTEQQELLLRRFQEWFAARLATPQHLLDLDLERALADLHHLTAAQPRVALLPLPESRRPLLTLPPLPPAPKLRFNFWTLWTALLLMGLLIVGAFLQPLFDPAAELPLATPLATVAVPTPVPAPALTQPRKRLYTDVPYVASISYEPLESWQRWHLYAGLATGFLFAALLYGLYLWRSRRIPEDAPPPYNPDGPRHFPLGSIGGQPAPFLNNTTLSELADSLGYFQSQESGHRLDVGASIQATLAAGGIPALAFHQRQQVRSLLILEDALAEPLVWNPLPRELAEGVARYGVPVIYGRFYGSPAHFKTPDGAIHRLEDLEDQRQGFLLLLCSDGKSLHRADDSFALERLARWPQVAWLELREPRFWAESATLARRYALPLYPATPTGALQAVRRFLTEQGATVSYVTTGATQPGLPSQADTRPDAYVEQLLGDALLWAQECAMIQPVTPGLADQLRRNFHPHLPPERIERLYVLPDTLVNISGLRFSEEVQRVLRRGFLHRRSDREQEAVLRFLLAAIEKVEPGEDDSPAHLAWEAVRERVRLDLDQDAALARLAQLAKTPVGPAISQSLTGFGLPEEAAIKIPLRLKPANPNAWQRLARISDGFNIPKLEAYPVGWGHRVAVELLGLLFVVCNGLGVADYLYPTLSEQNWRVVGPPQTLALLKVKAGDTDRWQVKAAGELHALVADPLPPTFEHQLILYGGGHQAAHALPLKNHQMTVLTVVRSDEDNPVDAACQEPFAEHSLILRCAEAEDGAEPVVQQPSWRTRLGTAAPEGQMMSIGLELAGHEYGQPALRRGRELLLRSSSVDVIYRVQPDAAGQWPLAQLQAELAPLAGQSQLLWWTDGAPPAPALAALLEPFAVAYQLGADAESAWVERLARLLQTGDGAPVRGATLAAALEVEPATLPAALALLPLPALPTRGAAPLLSVPVTSDPATAATGSLPPARATTGISSAIVISGMVFVPVPAGEFLMGSTPEQIDAAVELCQQVYKDCNRDAYTDEADQHTVDLPAFWIMRTEVTNAQYRPFVEAKGYEQQEFWTDAGWQWREGNKVTQPACWEDKDFGQDDYPVVCVTWYEAMAYANWLANATGQPIRLPSEAQWEKAARGTAGQIFPWGNQWDGSRLNFCDSNCTYDDWKDKNSDDGYTTTAPVGSYPLGISPYGALDMSGNVWEWTSSQYMSYPYAATDSRENLEGDARRVVRGGAWFGPVVFVRAAARLLLAPDDRGDLVGVRLVVFAPQ